MSGRILLKPGALMTPIAPAGYAILHALAVVAKEMQRDLTITSGTDGEHSGPSDPHKLGEAYDVRSKDFPDYDTKMVFLGAIILELGPAFFAQLENQGDVTEHFHIQRKRSTIYSISALLERLTRKG